MGHPVLKLDPIKMGNVIIDQTLMEIPRGLNPPIRMRKKHTRNNKEKNKKTKNNMR